ncbi:MAG: ArsC family reductase [Gammaproteobacteria bacterium]|uniref:ArsC family reductase n=1 Tax=Pseudomaricurvus alcaniphilus TaxID=1166482 RepID=UPI00140ADCEB|nr:ArsC family reductase [Pseudomaricurvus alcaniphilus]MBR9911022.1 ArsC family reductase [Gammaproteobacteria bacterium]NHN37730.1 ArsC family reductase [Pseudomaricurvus alcaniphilus]
MTRLYGISNCDTVKKARNWLDSHSVDYQYCDFRKDGLSRADVIEWVTQLGWETLVNKRSTTWKTLDDATRQQITDASVVDLILAHPTLIKRPLLARDDLLKVGFKPAEYQSLFQ